MEKVFQKQKEACLAGVDLSRKGSVDEPIVQLVSYINRQEHYVTTSSCSGRIAVFCYPSGGEIKKKGCQWLYITHDLCTKEKVMEALKDCDGDIFFKFEAFVLHVQCATLQHAQKMLAEAVASGYRNSGISISKKGKIVTAIRSTHSLEVPLSHNGNVMVSEEYIDYLVKLGNERMCENKTRINRFFENLSVALSTDMLENASKSKQRKNSNKKADTDTHHNGRTKTSGQHNEKTCQQLDKVCEELSDLFDNDIDLNIFEPE